MDTTPYQGFKKCGNLVAKRWMQNAGESDAGLAALLALQGGSGELLAHGNFVT
ncbi:MAG TPA: hypothetical protein VGP06_12205 [Janthinobacterium sp.]|jgi:hypothetical protein|nr:hypothetical protein [Janthinobacterium sp.]